MKYQEYMQQKNHNICVFCNIQSFEILEESEHFLVVPNRGPYHQDHILILTKEHFILMEELSDDVYLELSLLLRKWGQKIKHQHSEVVILLRDGMAGGPTGKSVDHFHAHIVPDCKVSREDASQRSFLDDDIYQQEAKRMKILYSD